jgi:hypothetical protein
LFGNRQNISDFYNMGGGGSVLFDDGGYRVATVLVFSRGQTGLMVFH